MHFLYLKSEVYYIILFRGNKAGVVKHYGKSKIFTFCIWNVKPKKLAMHESSCQGNFYNYLVIYLVRKWQVI